MLAEADYGNRSYWFEEEAGNSTEEGAVNEKYEWFKKYFYPYMKIVKHKPFYQGTSGVYVYYLPDGGAFGSVNGGKVNRDWLFGLETRTNVQIMTVQPVYVDFGFSTPLEVPPFIKIKVLSLGVRPVSRKNFWKTVKIQNTDMIVQL